MAYSQRWGEQRWPEVPPDRDAGPPARAGRRRPEPHPEPHEEPEDLDYPDDSPFDADRPVVNPYAVVALVAALVRHLGARWWTATALAPVALFVTYVAADGWHRQGAFVGLDLWFALCVAMAVAAWRRSVAGARSSGP